jgi:hypothetical protein
MMFLISLCALRAFVVNPSFTQRFLSLVLRQPCSKLVQFYKSGSSRRIFRQELVS